MLNEMQHCKRGGEGGEGKVKLANLPNTSVCGCMLSLRSFFFFSGNHGSKFQNVYISLSGYDSDSCGSPRQPCRSIAQAVRQVSWGGSVHLDGTGTEPTPLRLSSPCST